MADWSLPVTTTLYTGVLSDLDDRLDELAKMFDGASPTNLPTGAFRIDGSSNNALQTWNGASWDNESLAVQILRIGQNAVNSEASVTDLAFFANANIASEGNLNFYIDSDNDATDRLYRWYNNAASTSGANLLMSLSEAGALTLTGQMSIASGGATNIFSLDADTGFDSVIRFKENDVIRALAFYDESNDILKLQKIASNGTTVQAELSLGDNGIINAIGKFSITDELQLQGGYSEDADSYGLGGAITLNLSLATFWYPTGALTSIPTFTFSNPAASGRVTSFTMELNNGDGFAPVWPGSVAWAGGTEPEWSSGIDIITFFTRDAGTIWDGFSGGLDMQ